MTGIRTSAAYASDERPESEDLRPETDERPKVSTVPAPTQIEEQALIEATAGIPTFKTTIVKDTFIYTVLTKEADDRIAMTMEKEARTIQKRELLDQRYRERVLMSCVLWPISFTSQLLAQLPAGVEYTLFSKIMAASGMAEPIYGDTRLTAYKEPVTPSAEEIERLRADPRLSRLGLVHRQIKELLVDEDGNSSLQTAAHFIYTAIERGAYGKIVSEAESSPTAADELILKFGVVWPTNFDWDLSPAGWARLIAQGILDLSGFSPNPGTTEDIQLA